MSSQTFALETASGRTVHGVVDLPAAPGPHPTVVICHGFKGFLEWGFYPPLVDLFTARGLAVVRFNFTGAGMRPGDELVTDLAAFRDNTYAREQEDLGTVLDALPERLAAGHLDGRRFALLGHSRGGGAAVLAASREPYRSRLACLVTWAAIARIRRFSAGERALWRAHGELPIENARTHQQLSLGPAMLAEMESEPPELDILAAAGRRRAPWLILHGDRDESVPTAEADELAGAAARPFELVKIGGGDHTFGARHPFAGPTPQLIEVFNRTQTWLLRHLAGEPSP